jgi:hypothetical protein
MYEGVIIIFYSPLSLWEKRGNSLSLGGHVDHMYI